MIGIYFSGTGAGVLARLLQNGRPQREGLGFGSRLAGFFGQRLYFGHKTKAYSDQLKIDAGKCVGCGKCVGLCPMKNLRLDGGKAVPDSRCTMCYRCINECPAQAILSEELYYVISLKERMRVDEEQNKIQRDARSD